MPEQPAKTYVQEIHGKQYMVIDALDTMSRFLVQSQSRPGTWHVVAVERLDPTLPPHAANCTCERRENVPQEDCAHMEAANKQLFPTRRPAEYAELEVMSEPISLEEAKELRAKSATRRPRRSAPDPDEEPLPFVGFLYETPNEPKD